MKKWLASLYLIAWISLIVGLPAERITAASPGATRLPDSSSSDSLLVKFQGRFDDASAKAFFAERGLRPLDVLPEIGVWNVSPESQSPATALADLQNASDVLWAEPNGQVHATEIVPNDNYYLAQQENLRVIGLPEAWTITTGIQVPIAVIDSGVDLTHADLKNKLWRNNGEIPANLLDDDQNGFADDVYGWDFVNNDALPQDDFTHGSHVAGIAAAETNNDIGIAGVAWGARIMAIKALDQNGDGSWFDVAAGILYAAEMGARIINMSFGAIDSSLTIEAAVQAAAGQGCLLIASAGNGGGAVLYPAALPEVVAVAATNNQDLPWSFSNRGPEVELAAPGVHIISANAYGSYTFLDGTSMSAPHVSGVAALIWSVRPEFSAQEVRGVLVATAKDIWSPGWDSLTGWGRLDAYQALKASTPPFIYLPILAKNYPPIHWHYLPLLFSTDSSPQ